MNTHITEDDRELLELVELRKLLRYEPETGKFYWLKTLSNSACAGKEAGTGKNSHGYHQIQINKKQYKVARLAWFYTHGVWPDQIDHINGNRSDNRIFNLRSVNKTTNTRNQRKPHSNNKLGIQGVTKKSHNKFYAEIKVNGKKIHLGSFNSANEASIAYQEAKRKYHAEAMT